MTYEKRPTKACKETQYSVKRDLLKHTLPQAFQSPKMLPKTLVGKETYYSM